MNGSSDIVCFESGSPVRDPWFGPLSHLGADLESLRALAAQRLIELTEANGYATIMGGDRVGMVVLPSGRRLFIRTKIPNVVLLEWLMFLKELPSLKRWLQEAGIGSGDDFHICIARLFLRELSQITRHHLRKDYTIHQAEEAFVRGRVLPTRLARRVHRLPRLPLAHRRRTLDTPYNTVLALALDRLRVYHRQFPGEDRGVLGLLQDQWHAVCRVVNDPATAATEAQWACPPGYRDAMQLARLILQGLSLMPESSMGGQSFTLPLALLWERALRKICSDLSVESGWVPVPDAQRTRVWDDAKGTSDPSRWLSADIMLEQLPARWILDAKYKRAFGSESRSDRFQMCAYALAFDADRVTLVYPTAQQQGYRTRDLLTVAIGNKPVLIDSLELPMASGPQACLNALSLVCRHAGRSGAAPR